MRARRRPLAVLFLAVLSMLAVAAACATPEEGLPGAGSAAESPSTPREGGRIVVGTTAEADGFLPSINRWSPPTLLIARAVYDPLATLDDSGEARPYLAESVTPNEAYTQWTIKLREGVTFHDGEPLTSEAIEKHVAAIQASEVTRSAISYFKATSRPDPLTFVIDLDRPWAHLPGLLASQLGFLPAPAMYGTDNEAAPSHPIGTGPFRFTSWSEGERLVVDRNQSYWRTDREGRQLPYLSQVEFRPIPDDSVRSAGLRDGNLDVVQTEAYREVSAFQALDREDPGGRIRALLDDSQGAETGVVLNLQSGPFADRRLRLAAAYAIDRKALVEQMFNGFYEVADGPFTGDSKWGTAQDYPTYFPERARQLVTDWRNDSEDRKAPVVKLTNLAVADSVPVAQRIVKWWTDAGFEVQLRNEAEKVGTVGLVYGRSDAVVLRFWDRPDPDGLYHYLIGDSVKEEGELSLNLSRYQSDEVDAALEAARGSDDDGFRRAQYQRVWDDFAENLPILFLFHTRWAFGYQAQVHGLGELRLPDGSRAEPLSWGNLYLTGVWVE